MTSDTVEQRLGPYVEHLGLRFEQVGPDRVVAAWSARGDLLQPHGILHGGVHCAVVESVASVAADRWLGDRGTVVGVSNATDFYAPVTAANGRLPRRRCRSTGAPPSRSGRWRPSTPPATWSPGGRSGCRTCG